MSKLLLSIFLFIFLFNSPSISHGEEQTATRILLFGDSIIAGYDLAELEKLDHQLEEIFKEEGYLVDVINGGVSGDTTAGGLNRIKWTLEKYNPHIILIALGGNDVLRGFPTRIVKHNVDSMVEIAKESGTFVILSAVEAPANNGIEYQQKFNAIYPEVAKKYKVPLYPFLLKGIYGSSGYMQSDGIHPNPKGTKFIADKLGNYFLKMIRKRDEMKALEELKKKGRGEINKLNYPDYYNDSDESEESEESE